MTYSSESSWIASTFLTGVSPPSDPTALTRRDIGHNLLKTPWPPSSLTVMTRLWITTKKGVNLSLTVLCLSFKARRNSQLWKICFLNLVITKMTNSSIRLCPMSRNSSIGNTRLEVGRSHSAKSGLTRRYGKADVPVPRGCLGAASSDRLLYVISVHFSL
jgi:hypothetical protein